MTIRTDDHVESTGRWSLGTLADGRRVLSIPVANRLVDYEEDYLLYEAEHAAILADPARGLALAARCRERLEDARLLLPPGRDRGVVT